jgi:hypothetical protein
MPGRELRVAPEKAEHRTFTRTDAVGGLIRRPMMVSGFSPARLTAPDLHPSPPGHARNTRFERLKAIEMRDYTHKIRPFGS